MSGTTTFSPGGSVAKDRPTKWNENAVDGRDDVDEMVAARLARGRATRMNVSMVAILWDDRVRFLRMTRVLYTLHTSCITDKNENCFARAFGGAGGTCECRGGCPPDPPSVGDVRSGPLSLFSSRTVFGDERKNNFGGLTVKVQLQETTSNKWRA